MGKWNEAKLEKFLTQKKRQILIDTNSEYSLVTISNKGEVKLREVKSGATISAQKGYIAKAGDFIYSRLSVHTGAFGIVPAELDNALITNEMPCFEIDQSIILPEILIKMIGLPDFLWQLKQLTKGMGRVRIKESMMLSLSLLLPGIDEQHAIVKFFKSVETEDAELKAELTHQQTLLKKLRQQILQEAIEGKLTEELRITNNELRKKYEQELRETSDAETIRNLKLKIGNYNASALLERIQAEKAQLIKDKKIKKQKPLPPISEDEKPFTLPEGWVWCRLGEATYGFQYGTSSKSLENGKIPVLRMGNIQNGEIDWNGLVYSNDDEEIAKYNLLEGDLLFNRTNSRELVGKTGLYRGTRKSIYAGYLVRFHMAGKIVSEYANNVMNSLLHSDWCNEVKTDAIGQSNINATKLSNFRFPLPPLPEQKAIVAKVEKLLALCDQLESQITRNQRHAEQLMQVVLKEAFSGIEN